MQKDLMRKDLNRNSCKCGLFRNCSVFGLYSISEIMDCPCQQCLVKIMCKIRCEERRKYFIKLGG